MPNKFNSTPGEVETVRPKRIIWRTIDMTDGLPGSVLCIHKDRRGYIWFGTPGGLCRYDGTEFLTYTTEDGLAVNLENLGVNPGEIRIHEDSHGRLWVYRPRKPTAKGVSCVVYPERNQGDKPYIQTYTTEDGLPPGGVTDLHEDQQGRLWFCTMHGVSMFDGERFITYTTDDGLASNQVQWVYSDSKGWLYFGTASGVSVFDGRGFTTLTTEKVLDWWWSGLLIHSDCQGRLWLCTEGGVLVFDGQASTRLTTAEGLAANTIRAIHEDDHGRLWFATERGVSCYYDGKISTMTTADGLAGHADRIYQDRNGRLWFFGEGISMFDGGRFTVYTTADGLARNRPGLGGIYADRQGKVWFSFGLDGGGVSMFDGEGFTTYNVEDGLLTNRVTGFFWEDREGYLWLVHEHSGLTVIHPETLELLTDKPLILGTPQTSGGELWFLSENHLCCLSSGQLRRHNFNNLLLTLLIDSKGALWVGTWGGLYRYETASAVWQGEGKRFTTADGLGSNSVWGLLEARDGTIWASTTTASTPRSLHLCRYVCVPCTHQCVCSKSIVRAQGTRHGEGSFEAVPVPCGGLMECLMEDGLGRIWFGGWMGGGLSCYDGKGITTYTIADGLPSDTIRSITEDDAGRLWIGTLQGLCCFDLSACGHAQAGGQSFIHYGKEHALQDQVHNISSTKDRNGQLWFSTSGGVYRYDGKHFQQLTTEDGLPANQVWGLLPQPDGSMIIGTARGIVRYQPTATTPPPIEIQEVVAEQVYRNPATLELTATKGQPGRLSLLTISYHGLSLATRRMCYSYILEGYDKEWRETWNSQVRYENLPIGEYTFKVIAINRDLVTSETPATLKLKVVPDPRDVSLVIMQSELNHLRRKVGAKYDFHDIIGQSEAIKEVQMRIERAIESSLNVVVLITGETGTGKELVANAIHFNSSRKDKPKVPYNCAAIPRELGASTLFGHKKGAFTGADEDRIGLFEAAEGGTLILDEIGDMPLDVQSILLRVLEERRFHRVGEFTFREADVRIIAMTNRALEKEVEAGRFRKDLFYRLNEFPIHLPPLRERLEDVSVLAEHFLKRYSEKSGREIDGFAPGVLETLQGYHWPGNVRELENVIQLAADYAVYEGTRVIQAYHFPSQIIRGRPEMQDIISEHLGYRESLDLFKRRLIEDALRESGGNRAEAARMLEMHRPNLVALIKSLGIKIDR